MFHEEWRPTLSSPLEAVTTNATDFVSVENCNWITLLVIETNSGGAGTAHNLSVITDSTASGTPDTVTSGIRVFGETDIAAGTIADTLDELTLTAGVWASDTTTTVSNLYVVEIDPAGLGTNATSGKPNNRVAIDSSASSANTIYTVVVLGKTRYAQIPGITGAP